MPDEIYVRKSSLLLIAGLIFAIIAGAYIINAYAQPGSAGNRPVDAADAAGAAGEKSGVPDNTSAGGRQAQEAEGQKAQDNWVQDIYIRALSSGTYDKLEVSVKKGIPVRLHFTADPGAGCGRQIVLYGLDAKALSRNGEEAVVEFTPRNAGTYTYSCGMMMWGPGKLVVS